MLRQQRMRRGKRPISREHHADRREIRSDLELALALNAIVSHLARERDRVDIDTLRQSARTRRNAFTFATFSSGGCCDAIASLKTGLLPLWGTEVCDRKRSAWVDLTGTPDMGDTYKTDFSKLPVPDILWSGQTCVDYSLSGPKTGEDGTTGWMFVQQTEPILQMQPNAVIIEMVGNAENIHDGREVNKVVAKLSTKYHVHRKVLRVRDYGDESNRERLILCCLHKRLGTAAARYKFPAPYKNNNQTARDLADPDSEVPKRLRIKVRGVRLFNRHDTPVPGRLYKLAQMGPGIGHSRRPNSLYSWDSTFNTQTTHNGGGVRPPLDWKRGDPITWVRKTTKNEARKIASLPESYIPWMSQFDPSDSYMYECINMGVPIMTAEALNESVISVLKQANQPETTPKQYNEIVHQAWGAKPIVAPPHTKRVKHTRMTHGTGILPKWRER